MKTRYWIAAATMVVTLFGLLPAAEAHVFSTNQVDIVGFGNEGYVVVTDAGGCSALITATVADPTVATITPTSITAVTHEFVITAGTKVGTTGIHFAFVGATAPELPCPEIGMHDIVVSVTDYEPTSSSNNDQSGDVAEPINTFSGELYFDEPPDLMLDGPAPLAFSRYYASFLKRYLIVGTMGDNWRHNFEWDLRNVGNVLVLVNERGRTVRFTRDGTVTAPWEQVTALDVPYQIVQTPPSRFDVLDPRDRRVYVFGVPAGASVIKLLEVVHPNGQRVFLSYDVAGVLQEASDNLGRTLTFGYDAAGTHLTSVSDGERTVGFTFVDEELSYVTDAAGGFTTYLYDAAHADPALMTERILPRGNSPMANTFDDRGRVATQADAYGATLSLSYADDTRTTTVTDAEGNVFFHEHDAGGSLISSTNGEGDQIAVANDETGRRTSMTTASGALALTYHAASGRVASVTDANGNTTTTTYAARTWPGFTLTDHDIMRIDHADGTSETFARDARGNLTAWTDRAGGAWSITYNAAGQPLTKTNPRGARMIWTYDAAGRLTSRTDPAGNVTSYLENARGLVTQITHADGTTVLNTYDLLDRMLSVTDERGATTRFTYDANGNVLTVVDAAGNTSSSGYDDNDRLVTTTDRLGVTTTRTRDGNGRIVAISAPGGAGVAYEYDGAGRRVAVVDAQAGRWTFGFDESGNLASKTTPLGGMRAQAHDDEGLVATSTSATGGMTTIVRDAMDRVAGVTDFRGDTTLQTFDAVGNLASITLPDGARTTTRYDALNNLTEIVDPNQGSWTFTYDNGGRVLTAADPSGATTTYAYGARNRISRATYPGGGTLDLTYDGVGHLVRRLYSDGLDVTYVHDVLGRLTGVNGVTQAYDAEGYTIASNGLLTPRDAAGRIASVTLAPGRTVTYTYDAGNHISAVTDWLGGGVTYTRNAGGLPTMIARDNGVATTMAWDADGRLTSLADGSVTSSTITRDGMGRVIVNDRTLPTVVTATPGEETTFGFSETLGLTGATYDGMGRTLDDGARTYAWDLASRLTSIIDGPSMVTFTYDGTGLVLTRTEGTTTREFVWNRAFGMPVLSVVRVGGLDETYYVHSPEGALLYRVAAADGSRTYYHHDEAGNTLFLSDDAGAVVASYAYDVYGAATRSDPTVDELFTWGGRWGVMTEGASGLYRMRARVYDSGSMRFLSRDQSFPHVHPTNVNPYVYAAGDPVTQIDPTGCDPVQASLEFVVGAVAELEPGATNVGESTFKEVVDGVSDWTGLAKDLLKVEERALDAEVMAAKVARLARGSEDAAEALADAAKVNGWRQAANMADSGVGKGLEKIGVATHIIDGLVEVNKLNTNLHAATDDYVSKSQRALQEYEQQMQFALENYQSKKWTRYQYERWRIDRWYDYRMTVNRAEGEWTTDLGGNMAAALANTVGTLIPANPVTFESHAVEFKVPFTETKFTFNY